ncbi:MAG: hypothetical protein ACRES7_04860 [Gammaproteobacteria bacterium]
MRPEFATRASAAALLCFPLAVWFGEGRLENRFLVAILLGLISLRLSLGAIAVHRKLLFAGAALAAAGALVCALVPWPEPVPVRYYPVAINGAIAAVFLGSFLTPRPLVERIARLSEPDLPPQGLAYCRRLNWIWTAVLIANTAMAFATARWGSLVLWTLYNGLLSYLLIGTLWGGEYLFRRRVRRHWAET